MFQQKGLGIVEIVMLLVILAILASTAIPSFISDKTSARQAAVDGVAGSLSSAAAINYTIRSIRQSSGVPVADCKDVINALEGTLGDEYMINAAPVAAGERVKCRVVHDRGEWATFVAQGIS